MGFKCELVQSPIEQVGPMVSVWTLSHTILHSNQLDIQIYGTTTSPFVRKILQLNNKEEITFPC